MISAKTGLGVKEVLEAIVKRIRPPSTNGLRGTGALIFDSNYDAYRGGRKLCPHSQRAPPPRAENPAIQQ